MLMTKKSTISLFNNSEKLVQILHELVGRQLKVTSLCTVLAKFR